MVYDCFAFFNELDLLELRLKELSPVVDQFVLVEATRTFQKEEKSLIFEENKDRFSPYLDKITHIVVDEFPGFFHKFRIPKPWDYDNFQKNQIYRGLTQCQADDVIIFSDLDEIPKADKILEYKNKPGIKVFQQLLSNFFLNCIAVHAPNESSLVEKNGLVYWKGSVMLDFKDFINAQETRKKRGLTGNKIIQIEEGGWHFSFLGGWEKVLSKLQAWAHTKEKKYFPEELKDPVILEKMINDGVDLFGRDYRFEFLEIDDRFPSFLSSHFDQFSHLIKSKKPPKINDI